jgi:hypothetical protein
MGTMAKFTKGQWVNVTHANGKSELATIDMVIEGDFPAVYVTYTDRTTGRVSPSQVEAV